MKKNKYKGIVYVVILAILVAVGLYFRQHNITTTTPVTPEAPVAETPKTLPEISITSKDIKEENFTGTMPVVAGSSALATMARAYIDKTVVEFRKQANTDVPPMRAKFGADSPLSNYTIDISATLVKGPKTESTVMSVYTYTGGANGNGLYKVITASNTSGGILSLSSIIKKDKQAAFTNFVKKALNDWRPEGSDTSVVFADEVKALTFSSFTNWSLDDKNLTIYFDKYAIGPGVLGEIAFPLPLVKIKDFLEPTY